jgi:acetyl-CoA/propionyl-CoA carboxylase biotin carboxyl carrier protein
MRAALREMRLEGVPTTMPAHQAILAHEDFVEARHSTVWVEQRLSLPEPSDEPAGRSQQVHVAGRWYTIPLPGVETVSPQQRAEGSRAGLAGASGTVVSPMPGTVTRVLVATGDVVEVGQGLCAVEAMKMETVLRSGVAGTVVEVRASAGQSVPSGGVLVVIEPA